MNINGNLKSLFPLLWENLATNRRYSRYVDKRDLQTFKLRLEHEGLSFLVTGLPSLGKALDRSFSIGEYVAPPGFKLGETKRPIFLGRCLAHCLEGDPVAVDCYRQLTMIFYKLEVDYDSETQTSFLENFKQVDREVGLVSFENSEKVIAIAKAAIGRVLCNTNPFDIRPCHGTGATACRTKPYDKWHFLRYYSKLDEHFPYSDYFFYSPTHLVDELERLTEAPEVLPRARVCLVPKDSRGPRIISCEPAELMYIQQGLMRLLYETIESHPLTRSQINFLDQSINRDRAREASKSDNLATIDLSDASDRVSLSLIRKLFPPNWVRALESCRSEETILPSGEVVKLNKFAPMGSSVCFPVEALVFWAISFATLRILDRKRIYPIYVYGDDIIVDSSVSQFVMDGLESVGLKVNRDKSYCKGPFRESCGGDFYLGVDVSPVRVRKYFASSVHSAIIDSDFLNCIVEKFGLDDSLKIIDLVNDFRGYPFPFSPLDLPGTIRAECRASNDVFFSKRWNPYLQRIEHRVPQLITRAYARRQATWCELLRKELTRNVPDDQWARKGPGVRGIEKSLEPGHYADPHSARTKWDWIWLG